MIERERLEELIKQKATIWSVDLDKIILNENSEIVECYSDFAKNNLVGYCLYALAEYYNGYHYMDFDTLYETEEEMNWQLEFGNITRTETLNLLTWEEFQKEGYCKFNSKDGRNLVIEYSVIFDFDSKNHKDYINILDTKDYDHNRIFVSDYTKDGYTLACRKAKELFLGEKENGNAE